MNICITGGAGFIGSHLCENLVKEGHKVICIDNFSKFYSPILKKRNINWLNQQDNFILKKEDIRDKSSIDNIFADFAIDTVIHCAAMAGVRPSIENPELYNQVNITGTMNILEAMKKHDIKKLIFASSSSVYGNNESIPFSENDNVDFPISPYAATKKAGELLIHTYHHLYNISALCLRFFTVYGPRQRPDLAIYKFTEKIANNEIIPVYGDGSTERDYTYITDIIDGVIKAIDYLNSNSNCYEIFNLGESTTIKLSLMISTIEKYLGKKAKKKFLQLQPGDVKRTFADVKKSREKLNYNPQTSFEKGIEKFVEWYEKK